MTLCFFWIPIIELLYAIAFLISVIFNFIVDYWWIILLVIVAFCIIVNLPGRKHK